MNTENKTSAELRRELDATNAEAEATSAKISLMATGDPSNKTVDAISREQTRIGLLYVKAQRLKRQIRAAQRDEFAAEAERLRGDIQRLETEHAAAIEKTFAAVYPHLRYRDSAAMNGTSAVRMKFGTFAKQHMNPAKSRRNFTTRKHTLSRRRRSLPRWTRSRSRIDAPAVFHAALGPNPSGRRDDDGERKARRIVCRWASYRAAATGRDGGTIYPL